MTSRRASSFDLTCGLLGLFVAAILGIADRLQITGAVPASEFAPIVPLYASRPILRVFGPGVLVVAALLLARRRSDTSKTASWVAILGALTTAISFSLPAALAPGCTVLVLSSVVIAAQRFRHGATEAERDAAGDLATAMTRLSLRRVVTLIGIMIFVLGTSALTIGLVDALALTSKFVDRLVSIELYWTYLAWLPALAAAIGIQGTGLLVAVFLFLVGIWRVAGKAGRLTPTTAPIFYAIALALAVVQVLALLVHFWMWNEINELDLNVQALVLWFVLAAAVARVVHVRSRRTLWRDDDHPLLDAAKVVERGLVLMVVPWGLERRHAGFLERRAWRRGATVVAGLVVLIVLAVLLTPTIEDYRAELFESFMGAAILTLAVILFLGRRPFAVRTAVILACVFLIGAVVSQISLGSRNDVRSVAHEYSRFGALAADTPLLDAIDPFPSVGIAAPKMSRDSEDSRPRFSARGDLLPTSTVPGFAANRSRPLIIMALWDAARPDRMSTFGYGRETTPNVTQLASDAVVFRRAYTLGTATTIGVRQFMTGRYVSRFMLEQNHPPFFVKQLVDVGYDRFIITVTGSDHNGVSAEAFRRGWDADRSELSFTSFDYKSVDRLKPDLEKTRDVIAALGEVVAAEGPTGLAGTFVYYHVTGAHTPWFNHGAVVHYGDTPGDLYDGELAKVDRHFGHLVDCLKEWGAYDDAVIVLTADHGTGLGEHGRFAGFLSYEEQIRIPLVVKIPRVAPRAVDEVVSNLDLAPTLVNLFAPGTPNVFDGDSLLPLALGEEERLAPRSLVNFCAFRDAYAVIADDGRYKLFHDRGRGYENLFDLKRDPGELENLVMTHPEVADRLRDKLDRFLWAGRESYGNPFHYRAWAGPDEGSR